MVSGQAGATDIRSECSPVDKKPDIVVDAQDTLEETRSTPCASAPSECTEREGVNPLMMLSFIDRYLSLWIVLSMVLGVLVGYYSPAASVALNSVQILHVVLPIAMGLWFMMWPVFVKVKYEKLGEMMRLKGALSQIGFSMAANWLIGPFIMLACAWAFLPDLPRYRNGVIMVGLARCIAMVLIWNQLAQGDPEYCAILVALNSILQIILYSPLAIFFLVVISKQYTEGTTGDVSALLNKGLNFLDIFESVLLFLGVPLVFALILRVIIIKTAGSEWLEEKFNPRIGLIALLALLWTTFATTSSKTSERCCA